MCWILTNCSCESCISRNFQVKTVIHCPAEGCNKALRKQNFERKGDEIDEELQKEKEVRKDILEMYVFFRLI